MTTLDLIDARVTAKIVSLIRGCGGVTLGERRSALLAEALAAYRAEIVEMVAADARLKLDALTVDIGRALTGDHDASVSASPTVRSVAAMYRSLFDLRSVASEFVDYWSNPTRRAGGCGMCGGMPHSATCYVGRIERVLALPFFVSGLSINQPFASTIAHGRKVVESRPTSNLRETLNGARVIARARAARDHRRDGRWCERYDVMAKAFRKQWADGFAAWVGPKVTLWECPFCGYGEYKNRDDWKRRMDDHMAQCGDSMKRPTGDRFGQPVRSISISGVYDDTSALSETWTCPHCEGWSTSAVNDGWQERAADHLDGCGDKPKPKDVRRVAAEDLALDVTILCDDVGNTSAILHDGYEFRPRRHVRDALMNLFDETPWEQQIRAIVGQAFDDAWPEQDQNLADRGEPR